MAARAPAELCVYYQQGPLELTPAQIGLWAWRAGRANEIERIAAKLREKLGDSGDD